jgi:hypothetical protein
MNLLFTDFESYYDSRTFTLKKVSMLEYIKSPAIQGSRCRDSRL